MNRFLQRIFIFILIACTVFVANAQDVTVKASANKNTILIGEQITISLQTTVLTNAPVKWFTLDSIPHFDFVEKGKIDSAVSGNTITYKQQVIVTSFDSGKWTIPALPLEVAGIQYFTDTLPVSVGLLELDPNKDFNDISTVMDMPNPYIHYILWGIVGITILSAGAFLYFIRKSKLATAAVQEQVTYISPVDEAMKALQGLQQSNLLKQGQTKEYYTALNHIIKHYWFRRTGWTAESETNGKFIDHLIKTVKWPEDKMNVLVQQLWLADAVKFAKYIPQEEENTLALQEIRKSIELIEENTKEAQRSTPNA